VCCIDLPPKGKLKPLKLKRDKKQKSFVCRILDKNETAVYWSSDCNPSLHHRGKNIDK
jgi:hypothetical protein